MSQEKPDARLTPLDWLAALACAPVGCGLGLVYLVNGSPKAGKMLLVSILVSVVLNVIGIIVTGSGVFAGR